MTAKSVSDTMSAARAKDTIIVKHLPSEQVDAEELRERFARFGNVRRFCLSPSKTVAVLQFGNESEASRAFAKNNFSRYHHVPLFLEWAPEQTFVDNNAGAKGKSTTTAQDHVKKTTDDEEAQKESDDEEDTAANNSASIFVKNLNFITTEDTLRHVFQQHKGFRSCMLMKKKTVSGEQKSMGYGFVEFDSMESVKDVLKKRQGCVIDGHVLQLSVSQKKKAATSTKKRKALAKSSGKDAGESAAMPNLSNKLCVRNIAFEATKAELAQLFAAYGTITSLRLPKKSDRSGAHRGFVFIDYLTKAEATSAFEALQHTHFYGRKLVIEPAEKEALSVEELKLHQEQMENKTTETKKKKRKIMLEGDGEKSFKDGIV